MQMEETLSQVIKECNKGRHGAIQKACQEALDFLEDKSVSHQPYQLRARCLSALQMALESRNGRMSSLAIGGMQLILKEERFQSSMESEEESHWLSMQMLATVRNTASLPEDVQVEVMRLLLNMTMSSSQCMNAPVIICIAKVMVESFSQNGQCSVRTAAKATFTQLLSTLTDKLVESDVEMNQLKDSEVAEFSSKGNTVDAELLSNDVVAILCYLCDRLGASSPGHGGHGGHGEPLLLEGILTVVCRLPESVTRNENFRDLVWQKLCPTLIGILANPLADKTVVAPQRSMSVGDEVGRGSGCSSTAPNVLSGSAKTIYSISVNLVRSLGRYASLRPVLESLFHRMLLYPPPVHRLDAIKAIRPLLSTGSSLLLLAGPTIPESNPRLTGTNSSTSTKRKQENELRLLKLIVDSIQECCHCNDSAVAITSVDLINQLLTSVEDLVKGHGILLEQAKSIRTLYKEPEVLDCSTVTLSAASVVKLHDSDDSSDDSEVEVMTSSIDSRNGLETVERLCAKAFVERLAVFIPILCTTSDVRKADQMIQEFSSKFCGDMISMGRGGEKDEEAEEAETIVLNADAVYVTSYAVLHLSYSLFQSGYYDSAEPSLPISERQFIDDIMNTGLLLILSRGWLSAVFHLIIARNVLLAVGTNDDTPSDLDMINSPVLVSLFTDIDGLSSKKVGGQLLSKFQNQCEPKIADFGREANDTREPVSDKDIIEAGMLFARKVLSVCWDAILDVLSVLTSGRSSCGITGGLALLFNAKEESRKAREAICVSLEGLQRAARLSSILGLQDRCGAVFAQLATASCVIELEDIKRERHQHLQHQHQLPDRKTGGLASVLAAAGAGASAATKPKLARLHAAHALSMDIILSIGLELGSHTADCWQHVFKCCTHISELEHTYFSQGNDRMAAMLPRQQAKDAIPVDTVTEDDFETGELYSTLAVAAEPVTPTINVRELIRQSSAEAGWDSTIVGGGVLSALQAAKVLCGLSQEVDRLYEDAANKLNMQSLVSFLGELCRSSHKQLASFGRSSGGASVAPIVTNALLLFRLGDVLSRCVRSDRPLLHIMRMWNAVSQHLIEAACHRERTISQKAIACIHEVVTTLLSSQNEPPHFHFNEALCKPFENLLCLELCDGDAQDQIVCSLCELVEACTSNIKSGWKPIFAALRSVKIQYTTIEEVNEARLRHVAAVLDVFNVFLGTDNVLVFANAAVDCILCLLKYVRGPGEFEAKDDDDDSDSDYDDSYGDNQDLCLPALQYLRQCAEFLATMWLMPNCPIFVGANRIHTDHCRPVESYVTSVDIAKFQKHFLEGASAGNQSNVVVAENQPLSNSITESKENLQTTGFQCKQESLGNQPNSSTGDQDAKETLTENQHKGDSLTGSQKKEDSLTGNQNKEDSLTGNQNKEDFFIHNKYKEDSLTVDQNKDNSLEGEQCNQDSVGNQFVADAEQTKAEHSTNDDHVSEVATPLERICTPIAEHVSEGAPEDFEHAEGVIIEVSPRKETLSGVIPTEEQTSNVSSDKTLAMSNSLPQCDNTPSAVHGNPSALEKIKESGASPVQAVNELIGKVTASLDDLDNHSGVLHVFFLIFEGLANAVSACPKNYQPQTLEALFQLMRSAANVPGPRFALFCVNMLLLPTLQSWLRRGTTVTGYWDTVTVANCKHYTGLCVDLVVEYIIQFSSQLELKSDLELLLYQQLMVLVEFITEPTESLSRIGCSCIRHCLLHCGPVLSEAMWQITGATLRLAFDVTLFPLRQLMTPFHENSDNFYGDVGQVKVAMRVDSTPAECERLHQLSQQVFLLDSQRSSSSHSSKVEHEDQKSFVFLIYPPGCASSDPTEATRVPFRNLVLGLLSHQLLVQTVGTLLLHGTSNMVPTEVAMMAGTTSDARSRTNSIVPVEEDANGLRNLLHNSPLPGMLPYLSCRNLFGLLDCLSDSFHAAFQFDSRPGLKFLVQKVLRTDVAANLYKQAGISMTLYEHVLLEIASRHDNLCAKNVTDILRDRLLVVEDQSVMVAPHQPVVNDDHAASDMKPEQSEVSNDSGVAMEKSKVIMKTEHQAVSGGYRIVSNNNTVAIETKPQVVAVETTKNQQTSAFMETRHQRALSDLRSSQDRIRPQASRFICLLRDSFDEACSRYIDLYVDREGPSVADRLSQSLLVFLLAEPEELPSLKRDKSLKEMVAEKLRKQAMPVPITEEESDAKRRASKESLTAEGDPPPEMIQPRRHRPSAEDRVYTMASERTVKSLVAEYRRRKQAQSMPRTALAPQASRASSAQSTVTSTVSLEEQERNGKARDDIEKQIEEQQKSSIMKDGEAHLRSLIEMLCSVLQLLDQLPDDQFHALQPVFFQSIARLTANCKDGQLRHSLGLWTLRIGRLFNIMGPEK